MNQSLTLTQVLLLRDGSLSQEFGEILWSALKEVEIFYRRDSRLNVRRFFFADDVPDNIQSELGDDATILSGVDLEERLWQRTSGRYSHTCNQEKLSRLVRDLLPEEVRSEKLLLVLDEELTPPEGWRYVIWDEIRNGAAISLRPTDPKYWHIEDGDRLATIKHRVRTSCLSVVGTMLGLSRCSNPQCFLYEDVDSVLRLDTMVFLGPEHRRKRLKKCGFLRLPQRAAAVQRVVDVERLDTW